MNNLKKLKLVVASALLSSTAVYADDCTNTSFKGDEENTYFNVGVGLDYQLTNGIKAYVAGNFMDSSDEIHSVSGSLGVMGSF